MPLKKLINAEVHLHLKNWITNNNITSVRQKDKIYEDFLRAKNCQHKEKRHKEFMKNTETL